MTLEARGEEPRPVEEAIEVGPSSCLVKKDLADQVTMWLGKSSIDRRLTIAVEDTPTGVRFVVKRDGAAIGERTLNVLRVPCQQIHAAVGLGIASAIDATVLGSLGVTTPAEAPSPPMTPTPTPSPPAPAVPATPAAIPVTAPVIPWPLVPLETPPAPTKPAASSKYPAFTAAVDGSVLLSVLPKPTIAIEPAAELSVIRWLDLRASFLATGNTTVALGNGTADVGLLGGRFDLCAALSLANDAARLRGCAGILAGAIQASGAGFAVPEDAVSPWVAPAVRADARWYLTRWFGLTFGVDGIFPGLKPNLVVENRDASTATSKAFPLAGIGLSFGPAITF